MYLCADCAHSLSNAFCVSMLLFCVCVVFSFVENVILHCLFWGVAVDGGIGGGDGGEREAFGYV